MTRGDDTGDPTMTTAIAGPPSRAPWRGAAVALIIAGIVLVIGLILLGLTGDVLVDWLWFTAVGHPQVFWTMIGAQAEVFVAAMLATAIILWLNGRLALRFAQAAPAPVLQRGFGAPLPDPRDLLRRMISPSVIASAAGLIAMLMGAIEAGNWTVYLSFLHQVAYGATDPVFGRDIGFYLFSLPAFVAIKTWMLLTLALAAAVAGAVYWVHGDIEYDARRRSMSPAAIAHGSLLLGVLLLVRAVSYGLDRYLLLFGDNGVVVGAGYADTHVRLPILWGLIGLSLAAAVIAFANLRVRTYRLPVFAAGLAVGGAMVLSGVIPSLVERLIVKPNELELERPFLASNIALTREAYNLHRIATEPFPVRNDLTLKALAADAATVDNIRLWDWQPLMDTYAQLQEIRTYYKFHDVDVDRYRLGGAYQGVMVAARELKSSLLPTNAQTWVNRHLLFTHGNGAVMSPVTRMSGEGLPLLYLSDIPPVAAGGPEIREPRIYFGEETDSYVVVRSGTPEFDYPRGKENIYASYAGSGGIVLGSALRQALFAWYFSDINLLLSSYVTAESRIMLRRNIRERAGTIAPFLRLDHDPYMVIDDGRLFWIQDAYTTSRYFPYSQPMPGFDLNYVRNSVKIVIDAYNGSVDFYLVDDNDPIAATYRKIFPQLFKPLAEMPPGLRLHIRYPEDLFLIQARLYQAYHMEAVDVFYNREDLWQFPRQPEASGTTAMAPYYIIMRLPGEAEAQFFLMLPMVPSRRDNMIAWLAARCDAPDYGKLIVYEFPKDKLIYGPLQIEARINQNTEISQQLSLWNQHGSRVIRGNLLVIPIGTSILYVSPLYLRAEQGHLPELKRVIAAYGEHVVMKETLADTLAALFGEPVKAPAAPAAGAEPPVAAGDRARAALDRYHAAVERLRAGDWAGFGTELEALRGLLEEMNGSETR
jgi:uncharacterized membrane protein (UPF0182 family)